jgi:hypothetical protein
MVQAFNSFRSGSSGLGGWRDAYRVNNQAEATSLQPAQQLESSMVMEETIDLLAEDELARKEDAMAKFARNF